MQQDASVDPVPEVTLAQRWAAGVDPAAPGELTAVLDDVLHALRSAAEPLDLDRARGAGAALVHAGLIDAEVLPVTTAVLGVSLESELRAAGVTGAGAVAPRLLAALADGYRRTARVRNLAGSVLPRSIAGSDGGILHALRVSEARFRAVFSNAGTGILIGDPFGRIVDLNVAFAHLLGYSVEEVRGRDIRDFLHPDEVPFMMDPFHAMRESGEDIRRYERRYRHRDGRTISVELTASFIRSPDGEPMLAIVLVSDITERLQLQQSLRYQALHDPLTGLPNRALLQDRLVELFARPAGRAGICYLDLDRFKEVNDRLGHGVGDRLLVSVARRLDEIVTPRGHLVARMGGDEFVILAVNPPAGELSGVADLILAAMVEPVEVDEHRLSVSVSIGVVESDVASTTPADLLKSADVTLYWAKGDGRARKAMFDAERNARDMTRYTMLATMAEGLGRQEFRVDYQPIVGLAGQRVHGVEALVRWEHPTLGYLAPDQFIGLAEDSGAIIELGRWVLMTACTEIARWNADHPERQLYVSVNLAARQAACAGLVDEVAQILAQTGLPAGLLQLEVTERDLLGSGGRPMETIGALAGAGVRIAVDDFGSGYSNLSYLPRLPLRTLKVAGILVEDLRSNGGGALVIVRNLVRMAHELGLEVVAEGVETRAQIDRLRSIGCDAVQGWYYAKAAPLPELADLGRLEPDGVS